MIVFNELNESPNLEIIKVEHMIGMVQEKKAFLIAVKKNVSNEIGAEGNVKKPFVIKTKMGVWL